MRILFNSDYTRNNRELLSPLLTNQEITISVRNNVFVTLIVLKVNKFYDFSSYAFFSNNKTKPDPPRYSAKRALAISIWVTGSVDGVIMAANVVATTTTYFQADSILCPETIPKSPNTI